MMTSAEAAALWGTTRAAVNDLCKRGRIPGSVVIDGRRMIPRGTERPERMRSGTPPGWKPSPTYKGIAYYAGGSVRGMCRDISDPVRYVWINQDVMSVREMARVLGCTGRRVMELYDAGLRRWERDRAE